MTEQQRPEQGAASSQLKQLVTEKLQQGLGVAAKAAGQQFGTLAQAVRQAGEEMRQQGQENQGKAADRVAQPVQRWSGNLSQADAETLTSGVKQAKPMAAQQTQKLKAQAGQQLRQQTQTRTTQAGQAVTALTQGVRQTGQQLRSQGQEIPALVLDALAERVEPLAGYLSSADADQLRTDMATYGGQAKTKLTSATSTVSRKQQQATEKGSQAVKVTATQMRRNPALPIAGALAVSVIAARARRSKTDQPMTLEQAQTEETPDAQPTGGPESTVGPGESELESLSRAQLRQRAAATGIPTNPEMTKNELIAALRNK